MNATRQQLTSAYFRWLLLIIIFVMTTICLVALLTASAFAANTLQVQVTLGDKTATVANLSAGDLAAMAQTQTRYSSLDANGAPVMILAKGVTLETLLGKLDIKSADIESLKFASSDGWSRTYSADSYLAVQRYVFPQIVDGYDTSATDEPSFIAGTEENKQTVLPMLSLQSYEGRFETQPDAGKLSGQDGIRFCFGQTTITEKVSMLYGKHLNKLTILLKSSSGYQLPGEEQPDEPDSTTRDDIPATGLPEVLDREGKQADTLTITVGYYGGEFYTKKVFTLDELKSLPQVKQVYSFIDSMPAVCLNSVIGVRLVDILEAAGIDVNSVQTFHFYCTDVSRSWYTTMTKADLLDTPRFYYPNLPNCWDMEEAAATTGAYADAIQVDTVIALQDNWRRFATEADFSGLTGSNRFRLIFGQKDVVTIEGSRTAKWIHTIAVTLGGSPPKGVTLDDSILDLKIGSEYQLTAAVQKTDQTTDTRVTWSSSDENIVQVDDHGNVKVVGEGEATVTVSTVVGGFSDTVKINGQSDETVVTTTEPNQPSGQISAGEQNNTAAKPEQIIGVKPNAYHIIIDGSVENQVSSEQNWRTQQMDESAVALTDIEIDNPLMQNTVVLLMILFVGSVLGRIIIYRMEV